MNRTLRGAWSRRGTLLPLLLLTVVVTAGAVMVLGVAGAAGTSAALAVPLLVLGAVALPATGRELAGARRGEVALARLRGLEDGPLHLLLALEPLLVLVLGGALGLGLGAAGGLAATEVLVEAAPDPLGLPGVLAAVGIVLAGLVGVLVGMAGALREPLADQVGPAARPRRAGLLASFVDVLLVVAAGVAVYRASVVPADEPDWVVLAGPALVGLAVGQAVVLLVRGGARVLVARTSRGSVAGFLASRRLARVADGADALRVLVAAAVVAALAATGATQVADWTDSTARLRAGAPLQVPLEGDAADALEVSRDVDPEGAWLMAAVLVPGQGSVPARRVFLDTERYDAVAADFLAGTAAAPVAERVGELAGSGPSVVTGVTLAATVQGVSARRSGGLRPVLSMEYRDDRGETGSVPVVTDLPLDGSPVTVTAAVRACAAGCVVTRLVLDRAPGSVELPWVLSGLDVGGTDVLATEWQQPVPDYGPPAGAVPVEAGLLVRVAETPQEAVPEGLGLATPVLATDTATWEGRPLLDSVGGDERPAEVLDRLPALPLVEADGVLADLPRATVGSPPTVPVAEVMVLARADTPAAVLDRLVERTGTQVRSVAAVEAATREATGAAQAAVYGLMAACCLLAGVLVLTTAVARQRSGWLRDLAALRVVGLGPARLRRAGLVEVAWLAAAAVTATVVGSVVAVRLLLAHLALVQVPEHAVPLRTALAAGPVLLAAVAVAVLVLVVAGRGRGVRPDRSRPAILREEASR